MCLLALGCGEAALDETPVLAPGQPSALMEVPIPKVKARPPGTLFRSEVNRTVEEGLGFFLQRVSVEPDLAQGKFQGFRITELRPPEWWQGVDLRPGDVVVRVNDLPIERDIDAYNAFQSLRAATALKVTFLRAGMKRELVFAIVDPSGKPASPTTPAPSPAAPVAPAAAPAAKT